MIRECWGITCSIYLLLQDNAHALDKLGKHQVPSTVPYPLVISIL